MQLFIIPKLGIHALSITDEVTQHVFPSVTASA